MSFVVAFAFYVEQGFKGFFKFYEVIADENLSNGDTVKIVAKISKSAEKLAFNLKAEEIEVVVEGLDVEFDV